jgi:CO/xanthine dehydrogenase FAD-binding subunit
MKKNPLPVKIMHPLSLKELYMINSEYPDALLFAGGTRIMRTLTDPPHCIISLTGIKELTRIRRKENYLELGACVTLSRIVSLGPNVVPGALFQAVSGAASPSIRNMATIGGNICTASYISDLIAPLVLYDTRIEVKTNSGVQWLSLLRFIQTREKTGLSHGETVLLFRIPLEEWDKETYIKLDAIELPQPSTLKCAAAVRINKNSINDLRLVFGGINPIVLRSRELEGLLIGDKLPLPKKGIDFFCAELTKLLESKAPGFLPHQYHFRTAVRFARHFLSSLNIT